ncbi:MAG: peptidase [Xanthomonadaceae bacterium]|jgi:putative endopeptidase|nr:peptidase [Xanthomonadaceae bacterium]
MDIRKPRTLLLPLAVTGVLFSFFPSYAQSSGTSAATQVNEALLPSAISFSARDLDSSKNPCIDFNGYANGKWLTNNAIPADRTSWGPFSILEERSLAIQRQIAEQVAANNPSTGIEKIIGDFWITGMDEAKLNQEGIQPLLSTLNQIRSLRRSSAIAEYLRQATVTGQNVLFNFSADADFMNSDRNIAYITPSGLGLPDKSYYFDEDKQDKLGAYQAHIAVVLELSGIRPSDALQQARDIIAFETRLASVSKSREEMSRDVSLFYNPVSPRDANTLTPNFSWNRYFEAQGLSPPATFSLAIPDFFQEISKMLDDTSPAIWRAYLQFHTIDQASPYLSDAFANEHHKFYGNVLHGQQELKPRWKRVLDTINDSAGEAMGQLYVQAAFSPESKEKMQTLVHNLSQALRSRIEKLAWMSNTTKEKALAKWQTFTPKIGYPDKWRSWNGLQTDRASYLGNILAAHAFDHRWQVSKIGQPVDKTEWGMSPQTVNAYYNPLQNEIVFPAAILQPPFFDPKADDAFNYGGIGAVIGHEMTHAYDDQGSRFGPTGNFENWWTEADAAGFKARTEKLVAQFNDYKLPTGEQVNGNLTLGENIADLGGLATAYDAMKIATRGKRDPRVGGKSRNQNFFFNWATVWRTKYTPENLTVRLTTDPHAPAQFRAIGAPSNLTAFSEAFGCRASDPMVRHGANQVVIW